MANIEDYFTGKKILVTGATGLVGRVLVEKLLRDLPQIGRLYVLIRPRRRGEKILSAQERLQQDLFPSTAFDRLRQELGASFAPHLENKVEAVSGDLSRERLGLDDEVYQRLQGEIDLVINSAAEVSFDAPLDSAVQLNTIGSLRVMEFAKGCPSATVAHISTCYVNGTRQGPIAEEPLDPTRLALSRNGSRPSFFDIDSEVSAVVRLVDRIDQQSSSLFHRAVFAFRAWTHRVHRRVAWENELEAETDRIQRNWVEHRLVAEGMRLARRKGYNDTYTLTKALGEQLVLRHRGNVPTLIVRPSIIESALESPVPGWLDGMRMLDPLILAYSRGQLPDFPGRADAVLDVVPVDVVVNALLAAIPETSLRGGVAIYQVASGMRNPFTLKDFATLVQDYFQQENQAAVGARPQVFPQISFPTSRSFLRRLRYRYALPLMLLSWLALLMSMTSRGRRLRSNCRSKRSGLERLAYYARIYGPYAETECQYLTHHTQQVWDTLTDGERQKFNFDMVRMDWRHYIQDVHIPGLRRFVLGIVPRTTESASRPANVPAESARDGEALAPVGRTVSVGASAKLASPSDPRPLPDSETDRVTVADSPARSLENLEAHPVQNHSRSDGQGLRVGLRRSSAQLGDASENGEGAGVNTPHDSVRLTRHTIPVPDAQEVDRWIRTGERWAPIRAVVRWGFDRFFHYYTGLRCEGIEHVPKSGPFIVAANHSSHFDTGVLMVLLDREGKVHPLGARDYFFRNHFWGWLFPRLADVAPFDRHGHTAESLGLALGLLGRSHSLLFFPEGGRSPDGKMRPFKRGIGLLALESGVPVVPAYIQGSFQALPKGHAVPKRHPIHIRFGQPISVEPYFRSSNGEGHLELSRKITEDIQKAVQDLS